MRWVVLIVIAGCYQPKGDAACAIACATSDQCPGGFVCSSSGLCGASANACGDGGTTDTDATPMICAGASNGLLGTLCYPADQVMEPRTLTAGVFDTADASCDPGHDAVCILRASEIVVTGFVVATGSRPLVLWSATSVVINSTSGIDVSSRSEPPLPIDGAGANTAGSECPAIDGPAIQVGPINAGAGGTGGTYQAKGGVGGEARSGGSLMGGPPAPSASSVGLRGGCRGGNGGLAQLNGGSSGGAVYIIAKDSIMLAANSVLDACGAGGVRGVANGAERTGGGGGGSGGLIGLDAPMLTMTNARLSALGGGGASGGGTSPGNLGVDGNTGHDAGANPPATAGRATKSMDTNFGGAGGDLFGSGGEDGGSVGNTVNLDGGGGGGGAGPGFIVYFGALVDQGSVIAPPILAAF